MCKYLWEPCLLTQLKSVHMLLPNLPGCNKKADMGQKKETYPILQVTLMQ